MTNGRLEVGLGAGWLKSEYDSVGLSFDPPATRVARLEEAMEVIKGLWSGLRVACLARRWHGRSDTTLARFEQKVAWVREAAADRFAQFELAIHFPSVVVADDRRAAAEQVIASRGLTLSVDEALESPFSLIGTVDQMAERLQELRERFGISYFFVCPGAPRRSLGSSSMQPAARGGADVGRRVAVRYGATPRVTSAFRRFLRFFVAAAVVPHSC